MNYNWTKMEGRDILKTGAGCCVNNPCWPTDAISAYWKMMIGILCWKCSLNSRINGIADTEDPDAGNGK